LLDSVRELREEGKHRTEETEVTEGDLGLVEKRARVNVVGFRARTA
jgi:hypothetical protein